MRVRARRGRVRVGTGTAVALEPPPPKRVKPDPVPRHLAVEVSEAARAADDPFWKVKQRVQDLIVKLMEEAIAEADKQGFCDEEPAMTMQTREIKQAEADEPSAEIENPPFARIRGLMERAPFDAPR